jgi:chromosome segregation ATPase
MGLRDVLVKGGIMKPVAIQPEAEVEMHDLKPSKKGKGSAVKADDDAPTPKAVTSANSDAYYKMLDKAVRKAATDGFDYLKFKDTLKKMTEHVPDEAARYAAAGASAEAMKVSADDLIASAQTYIQVLNDQNKSFNAAQDEVETDCEKDEEQLKSVNKQLADLQSKKESLEKDIADSKDNVAANKAAFEQAFDQIADDIKQDISKIKKYLKN